MRELQDIFRALSDPTRLRILNLLYRRELCVCELINILQMSQSRISRHLGILKQAGLAKDRREGRWVFYSIDHVGEDARTRQLLSLLQEWINSGEEVQQDIENLQLCKVLEGVVACRE